MTPRKRTPHEEEIDDIDFEPEAQGDQIKKLKEQLAQCKAERQEYLDGWQRLKADTVNARRDEEAKRQKALLGAREEVLGAFLPAMDSFDMAQKGDAWNQIDPTWRAGMEGVYGQLAGVFAQYGIERFGKEGEAFDPMLHEAVSEVAASSECGDGTIASVLRAGWKAGDRILRPAQVVVAHAA